MMNCPQCNVHIDDHPPSRCLRGWVAASVMKWQVINGKDGLPAHVITDKGDHYYLLTDLGPMWFPDLDIAVAWEVERKIEERKLKSIYVQALVAAMLSMEVNSDEDMWWLLAHASPLDRCRAAIKACHQGDTT